MGKKVASEFIINIGVSTTTATQSHAGIYPRIHQVLDIDRYYSLVSEYLGCYECSRKVISWNPSIVKQLDIGHQLQLHVLIMHQYARDNRVVRLLRTRGAGNSSSQLFHKLDGQHEEAWLGRSAQHLSVRHLQGRNPEAS